MSGWELFTWTVCWLVAGWMGCEEWSRRQAKRALDAWTRSEDERRARRQAVIDMAEEAAIERAIRESGCKPPVLRRQG